MSITLRVTPEALKAKASEVERDIKKLQDHFNSIQDIVSRSAGYWQGMAGDKARTEFYDKKDDTCQVIARFKEHPTDLLGMAELYAVAEKAAEYTNMALKTDVIA